MSAEPDPAANRPAAPPSFGEAARLWLKIGLVSFGGPAAQIAILQDEVVERRGWIDRATFLRALNFCMLLPGPEAQQLATFMGLKLHGWRGALAAGGLFVLPGAIVLFGLAWVAAAWGRLEPVAAVFSGFAPVVVALIVHASWRLGQRTLSTPAAWMVAAGAFTALVLGVTYPLVIALAALVGAVATWRGSPLAPHHPEPDAAPLSWWRLFARMPLRALVFALLWAAPVAGAVALGGREPFADIAAFFGKAAFITFGGAYAVLPYVADAGVNHYHWLTRAEMLHGLGLAETTPGPLILVTQYVGFFAGWNAAAAGATGLPPLAAGALGAALTTWTTFLPCFFFILAGAPLVERLSHERLAQGALSGVTAAVVGVIATLGVGLGREAFFPAGGFDPVAAGAAAAALAVLLRWKIGAPWMVLAGGLFGVARWLLGLG